MQLQCNVTRNVCSYKCVEGTKCVCVSAEKRWAQPVNVCDEFTRRLQLKCDGTRLRTGGEVKGKLASGVGSHYSSHYLETWCIQH